jgi:hypothetical protein
MSRELFEQFIDIDSDNLIYLQEGRRALLTHPLRSEIKALCDASFCRIFALVMTESIENMLQVWRKRDTSEFLNAYFNEKQTPNGERIRALFRAFKMAGIDVDTDVFEDYLAIKYLRNRITHGIEGPRPSSEDEQLSKQGFPLDLRDLTEKHWQKMQSTSQKMMLYIALTVVPGPSRKPPDKIVKLGAVVEMDESGLLREKDLPRIFWFGLERFYERINEDIQKTILTEKYNWTRGLNEKEIIHMNHEQQWRLRYEAARKAGRNSFHFLMRDRELGKEAFDFWKEYSRLTFGRAEISDEDVRKTTAILRTLDREKIVRRDETQTTGALKIGNVVYDAMPNNTALNLLIVLPIVDPVNTRAYLDEGVKALALAELRDLWYYRMKGVQAPVVERYESYRKMIQKLLEEDFESRNALASV